MFDAILIDKGEAGQTAWGGLAGDIVERITLAEAIPAAERPLAGKVRGRLVVPIDDTVD
ncbi:hypothetical protein [Acuticoccus sp. I52.16.1]|uniref:hypothetical protein n=1 Tax=Acuticoccus sp. I52.16.1 TaxID=2928472 RepID=UPI001FD55C5E|nr:hypothetical protein [Acuticoccus sp. I52.16.1]UOM35033.1 hypothetical protein MRB58_02125 [Acuticoccus sp. I52.16.1]